MATDVDEIATLRSRIEYLEGRLADASDDLRTAARWLRQCDHVTDSNFILERANAYRTMLPLQVFAPAARPEVLEISR